jgi:uncharacterized protein (DUF1330 family)
VSGLDPSLERLAELQRVDPSRPLVLLELVRYAAPAAREGYGDVLARLGGRVLLRARAELQFIGRADAAWDDFLVVEFRSRAGFVRRVPEAPALDELLAARRSFAAHPGPRALPRIAALAAPLLRALRVGPPPLPSAEAQERLAELASHPSRTLGPDVDQLRALLAGDDGGPIVMFNLLAYRERAHYEQPVPDGDVSGREAYQRYGRGIARLLLGVGAWPVFLGRAETTLVGAPEKWDEFAVVEYPSRAAFLGMVSSAAYRAQTRHRDAGLARTELIQCARGARPGDSDSGSDRLAP